MRSRALTLCLRHALADVLCLFFALPQRIGEEKAPRGLIPLGTPQRVLVGAALPLRATRREDMKFQRLRARLKKSRAHFRAKAFALYICHACWQELRQSINKVYLISLVTLCSVAMPRGFPGGTPGRLFFRHFFATRQRNGIYAGTDPRATKSRSRIVKRRNCSKSHTPTLSVAKYLQSSPVKLLTFPSYCCIMNCRKE